MGSVLVNDRDCDEFDNDNGEDKDAAGEFGVGRSSPEMSAPQAGNKVTLSVAVVANVVVVVVVSVVVANADAVAVAVAVVRRTLVCSTGFFAIVMMLPVVSSCNGWLEWF